MRWLATVAICLVVCGSAWGRDWGAKRDPFDPVVVRRYKEILARDPHDADALGRLVALYKRYRSVPTLESEYQVQLAGGSDWATLVVLARLSRQSRSSALALWKRAVAARPDDAQTWIAAGDASVDDAAFARDAFRKAATLAQLPRLRRTALEKLVAAARAANDPATIDGAYVELLAMAPKDGKLWLDRGAAQLAAKQPAAALESFTTAASLLRTDPERRLTASMNEGIALAAMGRTDDAIARYEATLDAVPPGYYLGGELVALIIETERGRHRVPAAVARLEKRWPERRRGYIEWATLGDLYKETGDEARAIAAYKRAVAKAPTEVGTQRKLIALLDKLHPDEALAQHEAAARVAPGDADLQIELAKRYHATQPDKALATLAALSRRMRGNVNVKATLAALYEEWSDLPHAIEEYKAIATLEPSGIEHAIALGDAYWRLGDQTKANAAWDRLDHIGTFEALFQHAEVLMMHEAWQLAADAYTRALARDGASAAAYYGRARAFDTLGDAKAAIEDARRAAALAGTTGLAEGLPFRQMLVRTLGHAYTNGDRQPLATSVARWRYAFDHGDVAAGYLLAAHHARIGSPVAHTVLVDLYRRVPHDDSLGIAVARSYTKRREFGRARSELAKIRDRTPARAEEMTKLIAFVDEDQARAEREIRLEEEGRTLGSPDLVGREHRVGMRLELGADVLNAGGALLGVGLYDHRNLATGTAIAMRLDWTQRDDENEESNAFGLAAAVVTRILDARRFELAAGLGPRVEVRYGSDAAMSGWSRAGVAADASIEILPRALPATVGLRFDQSLTDSSKSSTLLLELGFEVR